MSKHKNLKKIYIIYEASIDHLRSQYSFLLFEMRIIGYKMNEFICEVSIHDDSDYTGPVYIIHTN